MVKIWSEKELFDNFVMVDSFGNAVSRVNDKWVAWAYIMPGIMQKANLYNRMAFALIAATTNAKILKKISIQIVVKGEIPVMIAARSRDAKHPMVEKLKKHFEAVERIKKRDDAKNKDNQ
jgi:hypothetical protein